MTVTKPSRVGFAPKHTAALTERLRIVNKDFSADQVKALLETGYGLLEAGNSVLLAYQNGRGTTVRAGTKFATLCVPADVSVNMEGLWYDQINGDWVVPHSTMMVYAVDHHDGNFTVYFISDVWDMGVREFSCS